MAKAFGIQVYEILHSGCLNGVYANIKSNNEVCNEVSKKKLFQSINIINPANDPIIGDYDCFYFEGNNRQNCDLEIRIGNSSHYDFKWLDLNNTQTIFTGEGWKINEHQIVIQYR
jgi:hypothetical protein